MSGILTTTYDRKGAAMADDKYKTTTYQHRVAGFKGADADKGSKYAKDAELKAAAERAEFDKEMGWSGLGGAAKKPLGPAYDKQIATWRESKEKAEGQRQAARKP